MELIPVPFDEELRFIGLCPDFLFLLKGEAVRVFLMTLDGAVDITNLVLGKQLFVSFKNLNLASLCAFLRPVYGCQWCSLDNAVKELKETLENVLRKRKILVCFSGGKDSILLLSIITALRNYVDFDVEALYVYIPFLDDIKGPSIALEICKRLGVELEVVEAKRRQVKSYLRWRGLPKIGSRWCTMFKVKPVREIAKNRNALILVADRAMESPKRCLKLLHAIRCGMELYSMSRKLYPLAKATFLDAVLITKELKVVNPIYLKGGIRVSCALCPYKTLYEFKVLDQRVEDPGLIENVLKKEFRSKYSKHMDFETFIELHLWRFRPRMAQLLSELHKYAMRMLIENHRINYEQIRHWVSSLWNRDLHVPKIDVSRIMDLCSIHDLSIS